MKIKKTSFVAVNLKLSIPESVKNEMENYKKFAKETHGIELTDADIFAGAVEEVLKTDREFNKWKKAQGVS